MSRQAFELSYYVLTLSSWYTSAVRRNSSATSAYPPLHHWHLSCSTHGLQRSLSPLQPLRGNMHEQNSLILDVKCC